MALSWRTRCCRSMASQACASPCGRRMPSASAWSARSAAGMDGAIPCACSARQRRVGALHSRPECRRALQVRDSQSSHRRHLPEIRSVRAGGRAAAGDGFGRHAPRTLRMDGCGLARRVAPSGDWLHAPMSIYEVHLGSWRQPRGRRLPELSRDRGPARAVCAAHRLHAHRAAADRRAPARRLLGLPDAPGYFAPTSRHGSPDDLRYLIDRCHAHGIGVLLDWVPAHFPRDAHGLANFDGTALYEYADPRKAEHKDWGTLVFNYERHEVRALPALERLLLAQEFHFDGLRVDAVASMLYLDFSKQRRRVRAEPARRQSQPRSRRVPARAERRHASLVPRHRDHRRRVDGLAAGQPADGHGRPRLLHEMEHGLDARHARVHAAKTPSTARTITTGSRSR